MSANVHVQRMVARFGELDMADAVAFAETIMDSWQRIAPQSGTQSVPAHRELNLALAFMNMKYPFICCGKGGAPGVDERCPDCPMRAHDIVEMAA